MSQYVVLIHFCYFLTSTNALPFRAKDSPTEHQYNHTLLQLFKYESNYNYYF